MTADDMIDYEGTGECEQCGDTFAAGDGGECPWCKRVLCYLHYPHAPGGPTALALLCMRCAGGKNGEGDGDDMNTAEQKQTMRDLRASRIDDVISELELRLMECPDCENEGCDYCEKVNDAIRKLMQAKKLT